MNLDESRVTVRLQSMTEEACQMLLLVVILAVRYTRGDWRRDANSMRATWVRVQQSHSMCQIYALGRAD
jgi:hypothetical protein